jgi:hypothetical protein
MHPGDRIPIVLAHLVDEVVAGDAGIVDEDVDRAEPQGHLLDHALDLVGDGDIGLDADRLDPRARRDASRGRLGGGQIEIAQRHRGAVLGQALGGRLADAARAAGDEGDPPLRPSCHGAFLPSARHCEERIARRGNPVGMSAIRREIASLRSQ